MRKDYIYELEERIEKLERENKVLKQKNKRIESDMIHARMILNERSILAKKMKASKEKRLEYFNLFLKYCGEIIIAVDKDLKLIYSSDIYKKALEEKGDIDFKEKDLYSIFSKFKDEESANKLVALCQEVLKIGKERNDNFVMRDKGGELVYYIFNVSPAKDEKGEIKQLVIVAKNVTEIYKMKEIAERAAKAKTNFLANTSHEIRTPMNAILGMTELILREEISDIVKENAINIKSAGTNLLGIINDILDISKIESGKLDIIEDEYEFASIINDITNIANVRMDEKNIKFLVEVEPSIPYKMYGDEVRLRQIIINLVNNGIKFTDEGFVKLKINWTKGDNASLDLLVSVEDSGIGIKDEDKEKLFQTFNQVNIKKNRKIEGTGLGLSICKSLLELMHGEIKVESTYGKGSIFSFRLPQKVLNYKPFIKIPLKNTNQKVLVLEENENYRNSLDYAFKTLEVEAEIENNEDVFIEKLNKDTYDQVFMPTNIVYKLKEMEKEVCKETKVVAMLGRRESYQVMENIKIIQKPIYGLSIAALINDENLNNIYNTTNEKEIVKFIAPKAKILIVDDNLVNLKVAKGLMSPYEMEIDIVISGYEAINMVQKKNYDIVFMDHMMPGMDGVETTKAIRNLNNGVFEELTIIALTANAVTGAKDMFIENSLNDFLSKPIEIKKLNLILNKWIREDLKEYRYGVKREVEDCEELILYNVNCKKAMALNGFTEDIYVDLIKTFFHENKNKILEIRNYLENDMKRYIIEVHGIKSSAKSIGAYSLSEKAEKLELEGKIGNFKYLNDNTEKLLTELKLILNSMEFLIKDNNEEKPLEEIDRDELKKLLKDLEEYLDNFESEEAINLVQKLLKFNLEMAVIEGLNSILEEINKFEYDLALEIARKIRI